MQVLTIEQMQNINIYPDIAISASMYKQYSKDNLHTVKNNDSDNIIIYNVEENRYYLNDLHERFGPIKIIPIFTLDDIIKNITKVITIDFKNYTLDISYSIDRGWNCYYKYNDRIVNLVSGNTIIEACYKQLIKQIKRRK